MKIAIPVNDESLKFFENAGHSPFFAIYETVGSGMFRSVKHLETIKNPRTDIELGDEDHKCNHDDEDHVKQHLVMGEALKGCDYLITKKACKNTAKAMSENGIAIFKTDSDLGEASQIVQSSLSQLK